MLSFIAEVRMICFFAAAMRSQPRMCRFSSTIDEAVLDGCPVLSIAEQLLMFEQLCDSQNK